MSATVADGADPVGIAPRPQVRRKLRAFLRLSRIRFVAESMLPVTLGLAVAVNEGTSFEVLPWLVAQAWVTTTHLMTHYCNEYFDLEADSRHQTATDWSGGSRVLVSRLLAPEVSLATSFLALFVSLALVITVPDAGARYLMGAGVFLAWFYTAPPLRLNYRALGEITTAVMVCFVCPAVSFVLLTGELSPALFAAAVPVTLFFTARMVVMNFVDRDADRQVGKVTLPYVLGERGSALLYLAFQIGGYGAAAGFGIAGVLPWPAAAGLLLTVPAAQKVARTMWADPPDAGDSAASGRVAKLASLQVSGTIWISVFGLCLAMLLPGDGPEASAASVTVCWALFLVQTVVLVWLQLGGRRRGASTEGSEV